MSVSKEFVLAGDAIFSVELPEEAPVDLEITHYTYRVQYVEANGRFPATYFVKLLTGPDNNSNYTYLGKLDEFTGQVQTTAKSCRKQDAYEVRLLNRILARVWCGDHDAYESKGYHVHHEGKCGRCGRRLTTPTSCKLGIGPECANILGIAYEIEGARGPGEAMTTPLGMSYTGD